MRVCVLGAGVVGLTTAAALAAAGCAVTIVDRHAEVAQEASAANGAQLSYSFVTPLASPDTLRHLPSMLLDANGPLRLRPGLDPAFPRWGLAFLAACRGTAVARTTTAQLALAALSRGELAPMVAGFGGFEFGRRVAGKLVLFRDAAAFAAARRQAEAQAGQGDAQHVLDPAACLALEPALRIDRLALAGGVFTPSEEVGDCAAFCAGLAQALRRRNDIAWHMGEAAVPVIHRGVMRAVKAGPTEIAADHFVLCLGAGAARFARQAGFRLPIAPLKGHSITVAPRDPARALAHSVTDADRKLVYAPLREAGFDLVRVAGFADLVGHDRHPDPRRIAALRTAAADMLDIDATADPRPWAGLRPATPDSRPIIGPSPVPGLFLNTGHGGLGWTLAAGSARLAADLLSGRPPPIDAGPFALRR